ncbi:MAG: DUF1127 domain-containing protein [Pseudomonadota bacterium]
MTSQSTNHPNTVGLVNSALIRVADFFVAITDAQSRHTQYQALNDLSDAELAQIGLKRHEIGQYVFRDKLFM